MGEELLEAQAVEEPLDASEDVEADAPRPLPAKASEAELDVWRAEVRSAALAAAGGIVAGAATVAAVRAVKSVPERASRKGGLRRRKGRDNIVASRSFLVDIHVLGR